MSDLTGPLRYLIGADDEYPVGQPGYVTECGYDVKAAPKVGQGIKYCNLFFEEYQDASALEREFYGPYLHTSDTAQQYHEGQIDPKGPGWNRNLDAQISRAKSQGFRHIELDNPDAYSIADVMSAVDRAWQAGLMVVAKNPLLVEGSHNAYLSHPAISGCVVEQDCGTCNAMEALRRGAGKPLLSVWFVCFGSSSRTKRWAKARADVITANHYANMGVSWSSRGEYVNSVDILRPSVVA